MIPADFRFLLKFGKHKGKTYGEVKKIDMQYLTWAHDAIPHLFKESKPKKQKDVEKPIMNKPRKIEPNLDFLSQRE